MDEPLNPEDYEEVAIDDPENPEWTDADFARAKPLEDVLPELYEAIVREGVTIAPTRRKAS